ncbi:hypothetical protein C8Q80DRAFT_1274887 [Daedaleopsis nitida]|nr:hypothetical protein C8Q80DRAFT_1274887 [Daedaleopsis nitida]
MSSDSDLTDIYDEEEEETTRKTPSKGKGKAKARSNYTIRGALKVPRATTYTCQSLFDQITAEDIDLQPEYQRDVVWPDKKQISLIDSIFRNFYVPPVIFVVQTAEDGSERRVCVDGKQRLTSIWRFISGEIPYKDAFTGEKFVFKDTGKLKAQILPEKYQKLFRTKQIVCMEYQDITPDNEREIFQRVQLGMALTPAERLHAIAGAHGDFIRLLINQYVVDKLASDMSWDTSRGSDFRAVAYAVYCISRWPHLTTLPGLAMIENWLQEDDELEQELCDDVHDTFRIFCDIAKDSKLSQPLRLPGIPKVAPMEVHAIALLIHAHKKKLSMAQLSAAIKDMRKNVREKEKDIRQNSRTFKVILKFIKDIKVSKFIPDEGPCASNTQRTTGKRKRARSSSEEPAPPPPASRQARRTSTAASPAVSTPPRTDPPTAPAAMRTSASHPMAHSSVPQPPPMHHYNSLGNDIMSRMSYGSLPARPNGVQGGLTYDPSRDPRRAAYTGRN